MKITELVLLTELELSSYSSSGVKQATVLFTTAAGCIYKIWDDSISNVHGAFSFCKFRCFLGENFMFCEKWTLKQEAKTAVAVTDCKNKLMVATTVAFK